MKKAVETQGKKIEELEEICIDLQNSSGKSSGNTMQGDEVLINGKTQTYLRSRIQFQSSLYECVKILATEVFTEQELQDCSISGKRTCKSSPAGVRPPLDQQTLQVIETIMKEKDPATVNHKWFVEKIQSVQKVLRRKTQASGVQ